MTEATEERHPLQQDLPRGHIWDEPELIKALAWYVYRHGTEHLDKAPYVFGYVIVHHDDGSYTLRGSVGEEK